MASCFENDKSQPHGFGADNFQKYMSDYDDEGLQNRDTHNTYLRCGAELGFHGLTIFLMMIVNAFLILIRVKKKAKNIKEVKYFLNYSYALQVTLIIYLSCGFFMTQTYHEETFWFLLLSACLERALQNASPLVIVNKVKSTYNKKPIIYHKNEYISAGII